VLIAITGLSNPASRRRAQEAGFVRYLVKPVDPMQLHRILVHLTWWRAQAFTLSAAIQQAQEIHRRSRAARSRAVQIREKSTALCQRSKVLFHQLLNGPTPTS